MTAFRALFVCTVLTATGAAADPLSGADAKTMLFPENGVSVELVPNAGLSN